MIKKSLFAFLAGVFSLSASAQLNCPPPTGPHKSDRFHLTIAGGPTFLYGDKGSVSTNGAAAQLKLDYKVYKGVLVGLEAQLGTLDAVRTQADQRFNRTAYTALVLNVTAFPAHFFTEIPRYYSPSFGQKVAHGLYLGLGVGGSLNHYRDIYYGTQIQDQNAYYPGQRNKSILLPTVNVGTAIPLFDAYRNSHKGYLSAVINGQFNFANDDDLDGFMPANRESSNDMFSLYTLGIRYSF